MGRNTWRAGILAVLVLGMAFNAAANSKQVETLLYDTHRKVTNLNNNLDGAIKKLNQTTSDLVGRVDASEEQTQRLRSMVEENQVKLDTVERQLGELTATIYRQFNLTTSGSGFSPAAAAAAQTPPQNVAIEPPARTPVQITQEDDSGDPMLASPSVGAADSATAHAVYRKAQEVWLNNDYASALELFTDFLARYPNTELAGNAQYWQGRCYLRLERYSEAITAFEKVRATHPENDAKVSQAMQSQAVALSRQGRNQEAEALLREVIAKYPSSSAARQAESDLAKLTGGN